VVTSGQEPGALNPNAKAVPEDKYAELLGLARTHYYMAEGGYYLYVDIEDEGRTRRVTLFVPEDDAPEYLE
jgi:hypothetical protein